MRHPKTEQAGHKDTSKQARQRSHTATTITQPLATAPTPLKAVIITIGAIMIAACGRAPPQGSIDVTPPTAVTLVASPMADRTVRLNWVEPTDADFSHVIIEWTPPDGTPEQPLHINKGVTTATIAGLKANVAYRFTATSFDTTGNQSATHATLAVIAGDIDDDNDGLIDIYTLEQLDNVRHNLAGTSYKTSAGAIAATVGAPTAPTVTCATDDDEDGAYLCGYELMNNLDFDTDGDGRSWDATSLALDDGDAYYNGGAGWIPIGVNTDDGRFVAIFEGNDYSIRNLSISRDSAEIGLFGSIGGNANIRNFQLATSLAEYTGTGTGLYVGLLAGYMADGEILASSVTDCTVDGGGGANSAIGGLVGHQDSGAITASYTAAARVRGGSGGLANIGGLVGMQNGGAIIASYATSAAEGKEGDSDKVGGLVGTQSGGLIIAGYATGDVDGGTGQSDTAGGLVGFQRNDGLITASYATGRVTAGGENADIAGALLGMRNGNSAMTIASYGFGDTIAPPSNTVGIARSPDASSEAVVPNANGLTAANSSTRDENDWPLFVWKFNSATAPVLQWVTAYDESTGTFRCIQASLPDGQACGAVMPGQDR